MKIEAEGKERKMGDLGIPALLTRSFEAKLKVKWKRKLKLS